MYSKYVYVINKLYSKLSNTATLIKRPQKSWITKSITTSKVKTNPKSIHDAVVLYYSTKALTK